MPGALERRRWGLWVGETFLEATKKEDMIS